MLNTTETDADRHFIHCLLPLPLRFPYEKECCFCVSSPYYRRIKFLTYALPEIMNTVLPKEFPHRLRIKPFMYWGM